MPNFKQSLDAWQTGAFEVCLKNEIRCLGAGTLPLHQGTTHGGQVDDSDVDVLVLRSSADDTTLYAEVGVFFHEIVGGCSCGDEPMAINAYCVIQVGIDKATAEVKFSPQEELEHHG
jgi:hypothetical protein